ncbi:MAG: acyl-CoA desaturase [Oceanococcaceae bacterium]
MKHPYQRIPATAHLSLEQIEDFGRELDVMRDEVLASRGENDRNYILRVIGTQRRVGVAGRALIFASILLLPVWGHAWASLTGFWLALGAGVLCLALAKILENMEVGHNVLHGQWDWMKDPNIQSSTWEWNHGCPSDQWMHSHNVVHHTWTNVMGRDRDIGYGMLRVTAKQRWHPFYLLQPLNFLLMGLLFEWFIALHDLEINRLLAGKKDKREAQTQWRAIKRKVGLQSLKDAVLWPLLGTALAAPFALAGMGPSLLAVFGIILAANIVANVLRNLWTFAVIFCGHFPADVHHFPPSVVENETRAQWYLRQMLGSCNIRGSKLFHVLTGNLSHQIEHHLFPDLPSNRYPELAPRVEALARRYGLPYNSHGFGRQLGTTIAKIMRLSFPTRGRSGGAPAAATSRS